MDFKKLREHVQFHMEQPIPNWANIKYALDVADSMREALIKLTGAPAPGSYVRLTRRAWPEHEWRHYLSEGNTGKITNLLWTGDPETGYWRVSYKPDCEWRWNRPGFAHVHEAPGAEHMALPMDALEVIDATERFPYLCECPRCGWKGPAQDSATTVVGNYAICPSCGNPEQIRGWRREDHLLPLVGEEWPGMTPEMVRKA